SGSPASRCSTRCTSSQNETRNRLIHRNSLRAGCLQHSSMPIGGAGPPSARKQMTQLMKQERTELTFLCFLCGLLFQRLWSRYHAIVNAVCAVDRAEPRIPTQVAVRALDGGCVSQRPARRIVLA